MREKEPGLPRRSSARTERTEILSCEPRVRDSKRTLSPSKEPCRNGEADGPSWWKRVSCADISSLMRVCTCSAPSCSSRAGTSGRDATLVGADDRSSASAGFAAGRRCSLGDKAATSVSSVDKCASVSSTRGESRIIWSSAAGLFELTVLLV